MIVFVQVMPKEGILDPQGKAVRNALRQMEYDAVQDVEVGKLLKLEIDSDNHELAKKQAHEMAEKLLVNPNVEQYRVLLPGDAL